MTFDWYVRDLNAWIDLALVYLDHCYVLRRISDRIKE